MVSKRGKIMVKSSTKPKYLNKELGLEQGKAVLFL
jgi:hypothetical protein